MATLTVTFTANSNAGAQLRVLGKKLQQIGMALPDNNSSGASTVLTIDNAPATGTCSVQITAGPTTTAALIV